MREVFSRYRGSAFGWVWAWLIPLAMLAIYTTVFGGIMKQRWPAMAGGGGGESSSQWEFAITLYAGLATFNWFAETMSRAPTLIALNVNLVKKVVFPLEILPLSSMLAGLLTFAFNLLILMVAELLIGHGIPGTALWVLALIVPLALMCLAAGWWVSALGVYFRDISHFLPLLMTGLMFLSPVFFSTSAMPDTLRMLNTFNPVAWPVEAVRAALVFGVAPDLGEWALACLYNGLAAVTGYAFFQGCRRGFADVL